MKTATALTVLMLGTAGLAGTGVAQAAAYNAAALCASPTLNAAAMDTAVGTIRSNTVKVAAAGFTFASRSTGETKSYRFDAASVRARYDSRHTNTKLYSDHWIAQAGSPTYYSGHLRADGSEERSAMRVLKFSQAWIRAAIDPDGDFHPGTRSEMLDLLIDESLVSNLVSSAGDPGTTHAFTCSVQDGVLSVTESTDTVEGADVVHGSSAYSMTFTETGALKTLRSAYTEDGKTYPATTEKIAYGVVTLPLPGRTVISQRRWDGAVVQGTFEDLKVATAAAARPKVKTATSYASRVSVVRRVAKQKASTYYPSDPTVTSLPGGVRVNAKKSGSTRNWWFRLKVDGAKVRGTTNLP